MLSVILSRSDVSRHLQGLHLLKNLRQSLETRARLRTQVLPGITACWSVSNCTTQQGQRTLGQLYQPETGHVLAVMEADHLTSMQASVVSALAADILAPERLKNVAVIGCGTQASSMLKALRLVRSLEQINLFSANAVGAFELARYLQTTLSMAVTPVDAAETAIADAELVVVAEPVVLGKDIAPASGALVSLTGEGAQTQWPIVQHAPQQFCAVRELNSSATELGEVLAGARSGRSDDDQLYVFRHGESPLLNLLTAWHVWEGAREDEGLTRLELWR